MVPAGKRLDIMIYSCALNCTFGGVKLVISLGIRAASSHSIDVSYIAAEQTTYPPSNSIAAALSCEFSICLAQRRGSGVDYIRACTYHNTSKYEVQTVSYYRTNTISVYPPVFRTVKS